MSKVDLAIGIGGAAGQGIATPGRHPGADLRSPRPPRERLQRLPVHHSRRPHLPDAAHERPAGAESRRQARRAHAAQPGHDGPAPEADGAPARLVLFNSDTIKPGAVAEGVQLCPFSVKALAPSVKGDLVQNTIALAAVLRLIGVEFAILEEILTVQFKRKGAGVRGRERRRRPGGLRLRRRPLPGAAVHAARHGQAAGLLRGQPGAGHGRRRGWRALLLRVSDEPVDRRAALDGAARAPARHHGPPGRGRDRRDQHGHRRGAHRAAGPCARPPAAASP